MDFATHIQAAQQKAARTAAMEFFGALLENPDTTLAELGAALSDPTVQQYLGDLALKDVYNTTPSIPIDPHPEITKRVLGIADLKQRTRAPDVLGACIDVLAQHRGEWMDAHQLEAVVGSRWQYINLTLQNAYVENRAKIDVGERSNYQGRPTPLFRLPALVPVEK